VFDAPVTAIAQHTGLTAHTLARDRCATTAAAGR